MVFNEYTRRRIVHYNTQGYSLRKIVTLLKEGFRASYSGVAKFSARFEAAGSIYRRPGSGRPPKATDAVRSTIERQMETDDETTAVQLHTVLARSGHAISLTTILRCRRSLGWTFRGSAYCQ